MTLLFFALVTCAIFTSTSARFKFSSKALFSLITNFSRHIFNRDWVISWQVLRWLPDLPGLPSHLPEQWWRSREVRWKQLTLGFVRYIFLFLICDQWLLYIYCDVYPLPRPYPTVSPRRQARISERRGTSSYPRWGWWLTAKRIQHNFSIKRWRSFDSLVSRARQSRLRGGWPTKF